MFMMPFLKAACKKLNCAKILLSFLLLSAVSFRSTAQDVVAINDKVPHHIFSYGEIEYLEDPGNKISFEQVRQPAFDAKFQKSKTSTPKHFNTNSGYWFKFRIKQSTDSKTHWILEFFDQAINDLVVYAPNAKHQYQKHQLGYAYHFSQREYEHKNFTIDLDNSTNNVNTYYIKLASPQGGNNMIVVLRDVHRFIAYALNEYLIFGLFYGMILIFSLYNFLMFLAIKQKRYLYYVLYNLSVGFYEMCKDGISFQYLWPNTPTLNTYGVGVALFLSTVFGLLFTSNFLYLKTKSPKLYKATLVLLALRSLFFIACLIDTDLFTFKVIEAVPLLFAFVAGCTILKRGFKPAMFFVAGYAFLLVGFVAKLLLFLDVKWLPYGPVTHYCLSFCFVVEMILVSFAIGDSIRHLRKRKDSVQKRMIQQLQVNHELNNTLNKELSSLVEQRTIELVEKAQLIE